ncbi:uncharacterized protein [Sinocyclocheilus grahami]|uniref:uncharacterized protein n=1 Tax=Sinocyclocheilus grahami TaxID=75366 RepID=UPI0007AD3E78|nr:PREDICTED: uncharacterized protein LOC107594753 [Sinocyclocheilus grahami]
MVNLSSGYHPQTNGQTERKIQELGRYLRAYCHDDQHSWSRFLPWAEYAQNSLTQTTTGLTPFQCILGYQPPLFSWTGEPSEVPAVDHWFRVSEGVWVLKEKESHNISQFRGIALLNVEGKIFFSVMAKRMTSYLQANNYIDTSCQKAGVPGFPGCVEHPEMIWEHIQSAKRSKSDLHVVWLDLTNTYGSIPHQLISFALDFHVPASIQSLINGYFDNFHVCYTSIEISTGWHRPEKGIAMDCSISPIVFTVAFEIILIGGRQMARGVSLGYKLEKVRLVFELKDSSDPAVQSSKVQVQTGRKRKASQSVHQAITRLKHQEVVGVVQYGRAGFGWGTSSKMWSKALKAERKELVISEVVREEKEGYKIKDVSQCQQGRWTTWEAAIDRIVTWADLWRMPEARLSFLIRATYDTLPSPQDLHLCCKTALTQGRYGWRHDQVLWKLAEVIETRRLKASRARPVTSHGLIQFVRQGGEVLSSTTKEWSLLSPGGNWELRADIDHQLKFPQQITITSLRPDIVLWSTIIKTVIMVELTVPWEDGLESAFDRKKETYADLTAACTEAGWSAVTYPVEVGCRGFTVTSIERLLKSLGVRGIRLSKALKDLAEEAERGISFLVIH